MIKHLEPEHVKSMPVVVPDDETRSRIGAIAADAVAKRARAREVQQQADEIYSKLINPDSVPVTREIMQSVPVSEISSGRRRFEGQVARSDVRQIDALVRNAATRGVDTVGAVCASVTLGNRFRRYFGPNGTPYRSAAELFDVNAPVTKRIYSGLLDNPSSYMLHEGWIIMACSGQTYGLLGRTVVLTKQHEGVFGSHDLIRIVPDPEKIARGYLQTVLNHELYGRPSVVRHASGTSIPHLDPVDIRTVPVPRFDDATEAQIADLCDEATRLSAEADALESEAISAAELVIENRVGAVDVGAGEDSGGDE
ncbi:hypothetical protein [Sinomonas sp. B1-1]|uniref:hypothetical protein n=1 Tax=Sinomonas sp. B1-1 TaxID=3141454 RepID=UPI003D2D3CAB